MTDDVNPNLDVNKEWFWLELDIDLSIRYHRKRALFHKVCKNINSFVIIFIGGTAFSGTLTSIGLPAHVLSIFLGLLLAFVGALDYIVGFGEQAKYHAMKRAAYSDLLKKILTKKPSYASFMDLRSQYFDVFSEEEGRLKVVEMLARNEVIAGRDLDRGQMAKISLIKQLLAPFSRFESYLPVKAKLEN